LALDEKARHSVKQRGDERQECGVILNDPGQPGHDQLLYCCTSIQGRDKETKEYVPHTVWGTVKGDLVFLTVNNMRKEGGAVVRRGILRVKLRSMLNPQQEAQWLPKGGVVNTEYWNGALEKINAIELTIVKIELMNTPPVLLAEYTSEQLSKLPSSDSGQGCIINASKLFRSKGLKVGLSLVVNKTVTQSDHILKGLRISTRLADSEEEYQSVANTFTTEGEAWVEQKAAQCVTPELHGHLKVNESDSPSSHRYIGSGKTLGAAIGLTGMDTSKSSQRSGPYGKNISSFRAALATARVMMSGNWRSMKWDKPHDPDGKATFNYDGQDFIYTTKRIPGSLDPI